MPFYNNIILSLAVIEKKKKNYIWRTLELLKKLYSYYIETYYI